MNQAPDPQAESTFTHLPQAFLGGKDPFQGGLEVPFHSPVKPVQLESGSVFQFNCHPGIRCFNACCKNIDITLTPYDILRLKRHLGLSSQELVARYTLPFELDQHGIPGLKLATQPGTQACIFLKPEGCGVYADRPSACRYYALGQMSVRPKDAARFEERYFLVKEPHCKGHEEPRTLTVAEYRREQGIEIYDAMDRAWREILLKKRSSGPTIGQPSQRSMQLFDMCSYDMDSFKQFIQLEGFQQLFDLDDAYIQSLIADEDALLQFAQRYLKQVLFGEISIPMRAGAGAARLQQRKAHIQSRLHHDAAQHREQDEVDNAAPDS